MSRPRGVRVAVLALVMTVLGGGPAHALGVSQAVVDPGARSLAVTLRCGQCAGTLRVATVDGDPLTRPRRVGRPGRVVVALRAGALGRIARSGTTDALVRLGGRQADATLVARPGCGDGGALAASPLVRAFRIDGFGVYACARPAGRPWLVAPETLDVAYTYATRVRAAGRFVAFAETSGFKCDDTSVVLADVLAHTVVRRDVATQFAPDEDGCVATGRVAAMVLRPSGAIAWGETPGGDGRAAIRTPSRTLAAGADVDAATLHAIDRATIGWTEGGAQRTARLD